MAHPACGKKQTERLNFGKALDGIPENIEKLVHDITRRREGIVEALKNIDGSSETVVNTLKEYVVMSTTLKSILQKVKSYSRLRFKWTNLMDDDEKTITSDVDEEMASMMFAAGLWHMEHAEWLNKSITNEEEDEEKMKQSLNSLKAAASIFEAAKSWESLFQGSKDLTAPILSALCLQSVAEGQRVTIRRAISKNHKASLISELCHDVSERYTKACGEVDASHHEGQKWSTYLKFQGEAYMVLARSYQGVHLLETEEKCGESIVVLNDGLLHLNQATQLAKEYDKIKPKTKLHLEESAPFEKMKTFLNEKKAKSERENGLIYHARLPEECPPPLDPKCVVHVTALELPTGDDLTRTITETDTSQPEGEGEGEGETSADGKISRGKSTEYSESKNYDDEMDDDAEYTACACQRWLFVTICMPLFVVLSIIGFFLLVLLMPFRLCCTKGGVYTNVVTFLFEVFLMAPCLACKWASGKRKHQSNSTDSGKPRYGGTDDVELGNK